MPELLDTSCDAAQEDAENDRPCGVLDFVPPCSGTRVSTFRGGAIHSVRPAGSASLIAESHYATVFLTPVPGVCASLGGGRMQQFDVPVGAIGIVPAGNEAATIWSTHRESVAVVITPSSLRELAGLEFGNDDLELQPSMAMTADAWALQLAGMLKSEITTKPAINELYVDSLITLFGVHLLRNYSGAGRQQRSRGGLSFQNEHRVREHLAANFADKLSMTDLAAVCQLSPSHFLQAFTRSFGQRPHQYLTNLRLDHAARLLGSSHMSIADVAFLSGFSSQSHLTSTLRKYRKLTPAQLRSSR